MPFCCSVRISITHICSAWLLCWYQLATSLLACPLRRNVNNRHLHTRQDDILEDASTSYHHQQFFDINGIIRIKSLGIFFVPILLPKAISYYKSLRNTPAISGKSIQPVPPAIRNSLLLLVAFASIVVAKTFYASPENIFQLTQSRLQISNDVLFTRLLATPGARSHGFEQSDHILRQKLISQESRLLYFAYGPDALMNCKWCSMEDPLSYFYYTIPSLAIYHLTNVVVLATATSGLWTGKEAAVWRRTAIIASLSLFVLDLYVLGTYNYGANSLAKRLEDIDMFHWTLRFYRGLGVAMLVLIIAGLIYISSTNRAFVKPLSSAERIENLTKMSQNTTNKLAGVGIVRNTVVRDVNLRDQLLNYWVHEGRVMSEAMEDGEVVEGVRNALNNRVNVSRCSEDAGTWAQNIIGDFLQKMASASSKPKHD